MASAHTNSASRALYRVFVAPAISSTRPILPRVTIPISRTTVRHFRTGTETVRPETDRKKWDEEIESRIVYVVEDDGHLSAEPRTRFDILNRIDRKTHRLVQVSDDAPEQTDGVPICKIMSKMDMFKTEDRKKKQMKERKKISKLVTDMKSLEMNWAIDKNDLKYRMDKMKAFLAEGRRVEIVLAAKKKGRKATTEECQSVLSEITAAAESVPGVKQFRPLDGNLGAFSTVVWQGKAPGASKTMPKEEVPEQQANEAAANG